MATVRPECETPGVILAGGRSSRMGRDKALLPFQGRRLLDHVVDRIAPQVRRLAISGDAARLGEWPFAILADPVAGQPGPLAGVLAAMRWAQRFGAARVLTVPVDTPFLPPDLVRRLAVIDPSRVGCARAGDRRHPVIALWPLVPETVLDALERGERRVGVVASAIGAEDVEFDAAALVNLNTPDDVAHYPAIVSR